MFLYKLKANEANLLAVKNRTLYRLWNGGSELKENWLAGRFGTVIRGAVVDDLGWDELEVEQVSFTMNALITAVRLVAIQTLNFPPFLDWRSGK